MADHWSAGLSRARNGIRRQGGDGRSVIGDELFEGRAGIGETFRIGNVPFTVVGVLERRGSARPGKARTISCLFRCLRQKVGCSELCAARAAKHSITSSSNSRMGPPWRASRAKSRCYLKAAPHPRRGTERFLDPKSRRCADRAGGSGAKPRHTIDRGGIRFAHRRRHQHHEHHAGFGNRAHPGDWLPLGRGRQRRDIRWQFLIEALTLALIGGVAGAWLGAAAATSIAWKAG